MWSDVYIHSWHECYSNFNDSFELFCFQGGITVQHTSLMIKMQRFELIIYTDLHNNIQLNTQYQVVPYPGAFVTNKLKLYDV